jgi:hypothetical protein
MTICSTTNIHHVVSASVEEVTFPGFVSTEFRFTLADGGVVTFSAFSAQPLQLISLPAREANPTGVPA